jgi:hypothetical protein
MTLPMNETMPSRIITPAIVYAPSGPRDLANPVMRAMAGWNMHRINEAVSAGGWGGLEFTPIRLPYALQFNQAGRDFVAHHGRNIASFYEGWRQPKGNGPTEHGSLKKSSLVHHLASAILFPTGPNSLVTIKNIGRQLPLAQRVGYVVYPAPDGTVESDQAKTTQFPGARVQVTPDLAAKWRVDSHEKLIAAAHERDYQLELSNFASDRKGRNSYGRMELEKYLYPLLDSGRVASIALSGGRPDFSKADADRVKTADKEAAALLGRRDSHFDNLPIGMLFNALRDRKWAGDITVRYPVGLFERYIGPLTPEKIVSEHRQLNQRIKDELPHITNWETARE